MNNTVFTIKEIALMSGCPIGSVKYAVTKLLGCGHRGVQRVCTKEQVMFLLPILRKGRLYNIGVEL
jgi:hypothetical protein